MQYNPKRRKQINNAQETIQYTQILFESTPTLSKSRLHEKAASPSQFPNSECKEIRREYVKKQTYSHQLK